MMKYPYSSNDLFSPRVRRARLFAVNAHGEQKYGKEFPYAIHLQAVDSVLLRFGMLDEDYRVAAWLHDTLEDTPACFEEIAALFGTAVAHVVSAVTEPKGGNRQWRHEQAYPLIASTRGAVIIKLADRIANIEASGQQVTMYRKEHPYFREILAESDAVKLMQSKQTEHENAVTQLMWEYLDDLVAQIPPVIRG